MGGLTIALGLRSFGASVRTQIVSGEGQAHSLRSFAEASGYGLQTPGFRRGGPSGRIPIMRDHTKLRAFQLADDLALAAYKAKGSFPKHELFGLAQQLRRAAVSCASNIVEGCARNTEGDYLRFLDMAYGSVCETQYQLSLAKRLCYLKPDQAQSLADSCRETAEVLNGLICSLRTSSPEV